MNKIYRFDSVSISGEKEYRLSRSIPKRSAYKIFFRKSPSPKNKKMFLDYAPANLLHRGIYSGDKRYSFYYYDSYVSFQNLLWKVKHGKKVKTLLKIMNSSRRAVC